jgi:hypothetical protein
MAATRDVATRDGAIARARTCFDDGGFIERLCALVPGVQPTVIATVSGNVVTQGGAAMPGNLIGLIVDRAALSYQIQPGDSLMMVATQLADLIAGSGTGTTTRAGSAFNSTSARRSASSRVKSSVTIRCATAARPIRW